MLEPQSHPDGGMVRRGTNDMPDGASRSPPAGETGDDEEALAARLAPLLQRKPKRRSAPVRGAPSDEPAEDAHLVVDGSSHPRFISALRNGPSESAADLARYGAEPADDGASTGALRRDAVQWFKVARRRRWIDAGRTAGAWLLTVVIGVLIVAASALMLFGPPRDLDALLGLATRAL